MTDTPYEAFNPDDEGHQIGEFTHRAVLMQLQVILGQCENVPHKHYSILCGALAAVASYALILAKPDAHRDMQLHVQNLVPWAFDQAAGMAPAPTRPDA